LVPSRGGNDHAVCPCSAPAAGVMPGDDSQSCTYSQTEVMMHCFHVHMFRDSFAPMIDLLNEHHVKFQMRESRSGEVMAPTGVIELLQSTAMWGALATIVVTFIKRRIGRKVIITTKDMEDIQVEGLSPNELEEILERSMSLVAFDPIKDGGNENQT
jgi:hypothetical protein